MQEFEITKYLGKDEHNNDEFVITVPPVKDYDFNPSEHRIKIAHDYLEIYGNSNFMLSSNVKKPESQNRGASNWLSSRASIQIPIKSLYTFILPFLNTHRYLQPDHFQRIHTEDDKYFEKYGYDKPRYKKGDIYDPYCYSSSIIRYYDDKNKISMVAFRRSGEPFYNHLSSDIFDMVKSTLKLALHSDELKNNK